MTRPEFFDLPSARPARPTRSLPPGWWIGAALPFGIVVWAGLIIAIVGRVF